MKMYSEMCTAHSDSCASGSRRIVLQTADVIQKKPMVLVSDYRWKSQELHQRTVRIDAHLPYE
jgi:hypothetical protein